MKTEKAIYVHPCLNDLGFFLFPYTFTSPCMAQGAIPGKKVCGERTQKVRVRLIFSRAFRLIAASLPPCTLLSGLSQLAKEFSHKGDKHLTPPLLPSTSSFFFYFLPSLGTGKVRRVTPFFFSFLFFFSSFPFGRLSVLEVPERGDGGWEDSRRHRGQLPEPGRDQSKSS